MNSNRLLYCSLGVNVLLSGICGYLIADRARVNVDVAQAPQSMSIGLSLRDGVSAGADLAGALAYEAGSEELPQYAAKLRRAGYSEPTIRNMVASRVATVIEEKRKELAEQPAANEQERARIRTAVEALPREQAALVSTALGNDGVASFGAGTSGPSPSVTGSSPVMQSGVTTVAAGATSTVSPAVVGNKPTNANPVSPVYYPAVMANPDPSIRLTESQAAAWEKIQDDFVAAIGGENQNPNDPAYRVRWLTAKELADEQFKLQFGTTAFLLQSFAARRESGTQQ